MDTSAKPSNPSSMRVLIRPPQPPLASSSSSSSSSSNPVDRSRPRLSQPFTRPSASSPSPPLPPSNPSQLNGVVVVGFIGRREGDVSQLINRVVDSDAFGLRNRQKSLPIEGEELRDWLESRAIGYYHDEEKGILYLQMCSTKCPAVSSQRMARNPDFDSPVEEHEFGDLQGMLFMFTVCHVIVYVLEGSNFDVEVLRRLRVLQSAKNALSPLMRSRNSTSSLSKPPLSSSHASPTVILSKSASPGRGGGVSGRSPSAISVMSGLGSYTSLFPGQCTPVTLFVFVDDFSDMTNSSTPVEDTVESSSALSSLGRSALHTKGSGSVVVLARPVNKSEGGSRKKLQSALEGQIRFLIKKCRALSSGSEHSHSGSRGGPSSGSAPLLTLDASRAVVLLDRFSNQRGVSLDYACGLIEDVLNGKATPDSLLLEKHSQSGNKEDIIAVKDFIFRQADILRGRGGMVTNANSGSAAGVGMVAVAAAAAAVSAASGKSASAPELPSLDVWVSSSQIFLKGIFSAKRLSIEEHDFRRRKYRQRNGVPPQAEGADPLDIAVSLLESGKGMNTKFSTVWCQRVLPAAMDVYMEDLPDSYPTSQHEAHLEKALRFYHSMVKGPSVLQFMKKLEEDCTSIWKSGRQLCDAVSLTGKPCMHQNHDNDEKQHCSGYVFLHACACGRSRRIRADPFDLEVSNEFNSFEDCDNLLPVHRLPEASDNESTQKGAWIIVKLGGSKYYDPYRGLLQSGFCANQKFLMKWTIVLDKDKQPNDSFVQCFWQGALSNGAADPNSDFLADTNSVRKTGLMHSGERQTNETQTSVLENEKPDDKKISFGNGLPNVTMKKPFSEVVAGSPANSAFPPLQSKKQQSAVGADKGSKNSSRDLTAEKVNNDQKRYSKTEQSTSAAENINGANHLSSGDTIPCVQIGNNVIQLNINDGSKSKFNPSLKHIIVYLGFEHECPHGHRFILSTEHLNELGLPYSSPDESKIPSSMDNLDKRHQEPSVVGQSGSYNRGHRRLHGSMKVENSREFGVHESDPHLVGTLNSLKSGKKEVVMSVGVSKIPDSARLLQSVKLDDGGQAFSLLNRDLPVYINCPHCRVHKNKKDRRSAKFAGTVSQLQRIFVVTPPFPVVLCSNPVVQFEGSCQALDASTYEKQLQFSLGCQVVLPPESFVSIRLPFIYSVNLEHKGGVHPLKPFEPQPELTAWLTKGTALSVMSKGTVPDQLLHEHK